MEEVKVSENQPIKLEKADSVHSDNSDDDHGQDGQHDEATSIKCSYCSRTFLRESSYKRHLQTHLQEPIKCEYCDRVCPKKSVLIKHLRTHTGEKPYECSVCKLQFATKPSLDYHLAVHNGERPYVCSICGKSFIQNSHLTRHLRVHTGEKPYCCTHCDMKFSRQGSLQVHLRRHTGEALFTCMHCNRNFINQSTFKYHLRKLSGNRPYTCIFCGQAFFSSSHVRKHERLHTNKKEGDGKQKCLKFKSKIEPNTNQNKKIVDDKILHKWRSKDKPTKLRTTSRNYCCSFCPMKFIRRGALQSHLTFHEVQIKLQNKEIIPENTSTIIKCSENYDSLVVLASSDTDEKSEDMNASSESSISSANSTSWNDSCDDVFSRAIDTIHKTGMFYQLEDNAQNNTELEQEPPNKVRSGNRKNPFPRKLRRNEMILESVNV